MTMENAEEIFQSLDDFCKRNVHTIPTLLEDYLAHVAQTGDTVFQWALVKHLIKEKLLSVIKDFFETSPGIDIPPCPNVDPFNFDVMKSCLLERLDLFPGAPFTIQRICELLTVPRKQYSRLDKYMRAMEKNILVVSTREPGLPRQLEYENGDHTDSMVNGSDSNSEYNVDVEMEEPAWKENEQAHPPATSISIRNGQPLDVPMQIQDEVNSNYESVTPPESDSSSSDSTDNMKINELMEDGNEETSIKLVSVTHSTLSESAQAQPDKEEMCEIKPVVAEQVAESEESKDIPKIIINDYSESTNSISKDDTTVTPVLNSPEKYEDRTESNNQAEAEENVIVSVDKQENNEINEESNSPNYSENTDSSSSDSDKITHHLQGESDNDLSLDSVNNDATTTDKNDEFVNGNATLDVESTLNEKESFSEADISENDVVKEDIDDKPNSPVTDLPSDNTPELLDEKISTEEQVIASEGPVETSPSNEEKILETEVEKDPEIDAIAKVQPDNVDALEEPEKEVSDNYKTELIANETLKENSEIAKPDEIKTNEVATETPPED